MNLQLLRKWEGDSKRAVLIVMKRVVFLHPDLGIGGAERLIVDAAVSLQSLRYDVHIVTNHHDPEHCFQETVNSEVKVVVVGDWFPRSVFGRMIAFCSYVRILIATFYLLISYKHHVDLVIVDQISAPLIILRAFGYQVNSFLSYNLKTLFYCHFPDVLLTSKDSFVKKAYRLPIDYLEEVSTGMANKVLVNSNFTADVFRETFKSLKHIKPDVLYPVANASSLLLPPPPSDLSEPYESKRYYRKMLPSGIIRESTKFVFLSINRYERKKNLFLALHAFDYLLKHWRELFNSKSEVILSTANIHLVIAGGYDSRIVENVEHYEELTQLAEKLKISEQVTFLRSCSSEIKPLLIASSDAVIYTPEREHFGIVPVEAMFLSCPVIALDSGGPKETIVHGTTGYLCPTHSPAQLPQIMATYLCVLINDPHLGIQMGEAGHKRALEYFSLAGFRKRLNSFVMDITSKNKS